VGEGSQGVVFRGLEVAFAVVVAALEDGAGPFAHKTLGGAFDGELGLLGLCVEEDDFADSGGDEGFLVDGEFGQTGEELALDIVGREAAVAEGFEEEAHAFEEVVFGVDNGVFDFLGVAVEQGGYFREQAELMHCWLGWGLGAGFDIQLRGFGHTVAEGGDFFVGHGVQVDFAGAAAAFGGVFESRVHGSVEGSTTS